MVTGQNADITHYFLTFYLLFFESYRNILTYIMEYLHLSFFSGIYAFFLKVVYLFIY